MIMSQGSTSISVFGDYFNTTEVWCRFTLNSTTVVTILGNFVSSDRIDCQAPPSTTSNARTKAAVQVSPNANDWSAALPFVYIARPSIDSIHPQLGPVSGGTLVSISGSNFDKDIWCNFKGVGSVPAEFESPERVYCTSPPISARPLHSEVLLHTKDGTAIEDIIEQHYFRYHRDLSLEEVYPTRGFITGGSRLTIFGTGFIDVSTIFCHFDSDLVHATFVSPTAIECISPPVIDQQTVKLGVSLNGQDVVSRSRMIFTYDPQPEIDHVVPNNMPINVENSIQSHQYVSVIGRSFINATNLRCMFGDESAIMDAKFVSENEVECTLPNVAQPGLYHISISSSNGHDFSQRSVGFTFVEPAVISSIHPSRVQEGSEAVLTIRGNNFISSPDLQCQFGELGHVRAPAVFKTNSTVECKSPTLNLTANGHTSVGITNNGGYAISRLFPLEVTARARFLSMYPNQGYTSGGTDVSIVLGYLRYVANREMVCKFGETVVPAKIFRSVISCVSPPNPRGNVVVALMVEGELHPLASGSFEYRDQPAIHRLLPSIGNLEGGTSVALEGSDLEGITHCRFGSQVVPIDAASGNGVICSSPHSHTVEDVLVQVTHNGQDFALSDVMFSYRATPSLLDLMPSFGGAKRGKYRRKDCVHLR
jgi:hypothetical protein